jgi:hypothetical protein
VPYDSEGGIAYSKEDRFKMMSKKFADALLEEEAKDDIMEKKERHKTAIGVTTDGIFKTP